jgi:hypothetical protein
VRSGPVRGRAATAAGPGCARRRRANPADCHAAWLSRWPVARVRAFALLSLSRRLVSFLWCRNNKRLERGKGDNMNLVQLLFAETINVLLTVIAITAIFRSK